MGVLLAERVDEGSLLPYDASPRYPLPSQIMVKGLAGRHILLTKSGARLDMIACEHPALNLAIIEVESDGTFYRIRFGSPAASTLQLQENKNKIPAPKPTSEMFHYLLIFERLAVQGFTALVHLQPKFLNLISRTEYGHPDRFYSFLRGYEPETPIIYDDSGGIGFVQERAPGIPELSYESLRLFENAPDAPRHILYWVGHGTFSRGNDVLDAYKHAEYFEAAARMAWEAHQGKLEAHAYSEEIIRCILREFRANSEPHPRKMETEPASPDNTENLYNYP